MRVLPIAFVLLAACDPPRPPTCNTTSFVPPAVLLSNEPAKVRLALQTTCFSQMGGTVADPNPATEVKVEVFDPDNHKVAFTATGVRSGPSTSGGFGAIDTFVDVTFTPTIDGPYSVSGQFEPSKGRVQAIFTPVRYRPDAGTRILPTDLPPDCTQYALMDDDLFCVHPSASGGVELAVGTQRIPGNQFVVDENALWMVSGQGGALAIDRLGRDAGAFVRTHRTTSASTQLAMAAAGEGTLWTMGSMGAGNSAIQRLEPFADGSLIVALSLGLQDDPVAIVGAADRMIGLTKTNFQSSEVVSFQKDGGFSALSTNSAIDFGWSDVTQLWTSGPGQFGTPAAPELRLVEAPMGKTRATPLAIPMGTAPTPGALSPACPVLVDALGAGRPLVPLNDPEAGVRFETFDPGPDYLPVGSANARHAFARSKDGKSVKVIDRR